MFLLSEWYLESRWFDVSVLLEALELDEVGLAIGTRGNAGKPGGYILNLVIVAERWGEFKSAFGRLGGAVERAEGGEEAGLVGRAEVGVDKVGLGVESVSFGDVFGDLVDALVAVGGLDVDDVATLGDALPGSG